MPYLATPAAPQLEEGYDSGFDSTDNITNIYTPAFVGTVANGGFVDLFIDGELLTRAFPDQNGKWWHRLDGQGQPDGTYQITVVEYDADGNASLPSAPLTLVIDTNAPTPQDAPVLAAENHSGDTGGIAATNDATPLITGQAEAGAHINLYDVYEIGGSALVGTAVADANGVWSITAETLGHGKHHLVANVEDAAGNTADSPQLTITVLTEAPERPYFAPYTGLPLESDGSIFTNLTSLPVIGYTEPGYTVTLYDGDVRIGSAVADASGAWSITSDQLADGHHALTTTITDVVGNTSAHSDAQIVNIKTHVGTPAAPQLEEGYDSGYSSTDNITSVYNPAFTGHLESGYVQIYLNGQLVSSASPNADGMWWHRLDNQPDGEYEVTVVAYDALGNASAPSAALKLVIDTTPPVTHDAPVLAAESHSGDTGGIAATNDATPLITGQAEAGARINLYDVYEIGGSALIGTAVADANGTWSIAADALGQGKHHLVANVADAAGNTADSPQLTIAVLTEAPERPYFAPYTGLPLESDGSIFTNLTSLPVIGYTEPGYTVTLYDGDVRIGSAVADASGAWSITSDQLADGHHALTTTITDVVGNTSAHSDAQIVNIKTQVETPAAPQLENAEYDSGYSSTDNITSVYNPAFTGHLESGHVELYLNGQLVSRAFPNADGVWWHRVDDQPDGAYDVTVIAYDALGNASAPSTALKLVIDTTAPAAPTLLQLAAESDAGTADGHAVTHDLTPAVTGQTEAGALVTLYDVHYGSDSIVLGSAIAGADGTWQIISSALTEGLHNLVAYVSDAAGNNADPALLNVEVTLVGVADGHAAPAGVAV